MRILHITDHYQPVLGGIETHVAALAARQAARGDEVTVLTCAPSDADGRHSDDSGPVVVRRARSVAGVPAPVLAASDVVHAHLSMIAPFTAPLAATAARHGVRTVVTVHSLWNGLGPLPVAAAALAGLRSAPVLWSAVSRVAAQQLALQLVLGLPGRRVVPVVLPNAVDVVPRSATPRRGDDPVRLVSVMRIARRKRPLQLVDALDALRRSTAAPVHLTVVGDGPLRRRVEHRVRRRGLDGAVTVTGRLEPAAVLRHLAAADVYVAPAVLESFGLAALEARCVGLPVVGHAAGGMGEFVRDGVEGWLCRSDADLVDRLRDLVQDPDLRHRLSEHNRSTPSDLTWANALARNDAAYAAAPRGGSAPGRLAPGWSHAVTG